MSNLNFNLIESEVKIILESLIDKEKSMAELCQTSTDEDLIADVGNDLIELRLLLKTIKGNAILLFGDSVIQFSTKAL